MADGDKGSGARDDWQVVGSKSRVVQIVRVRRGGWTKKARRVFLATLAETCNVRASAEAAGMRGKAPYDLRQRDPDFGALWQQALAIGYERLEEALLRHALTTINAIDVGETVAEVAADTGGGDGDGGDGDGGVGEGGGAGGRLATPGAALSTSQVQVALAILNRHRAATEGNRGQRRGIRRATAAETDAALGAKLDMLARKLRRGGVSPAEVPALPAAPGAGGGASDDMVVGVVESGVGNETL